MESKVPSRVNPAVTNEREREKARAKKECSPSDAAENRFEDEDRCLARGRRGDIPRLVDDNDDDDDDRFRH